MMYLQELFENFYYIWAKLKNGDSECKDVEWKRRMHFVLDQLKSGKTLTTRWPCHRPCLYQDHLLIGLIEGMQSTTVLPCYLTSALWWWSSSTRSTSQTLDLTPSDWAQQTSVLTKASLVHFQTENCSNGSEFSHLLFSSPKPSSILNVYFSALECQDSLAETSSSMQTASKITLTRKFSVLQPTPFWCCSKHFLLSWNLSSLFPYSGYLLSAGSTLENMPVRKKLLNALQLTTLGESSWLS